MPMYYPDLASIQDCVNAMRRNKGPKRYAGIYPKDESELAQAREELGRYFRIVWDDEVQALEVELAVSEDDYAEKMGDSILRSFLLVSGRRDPSECWKIDE